MSARAIIAGRVLPTVVALACAVSVAPAPLRAEVVTLRDASGRNVSVSDSSRIISIGGGITETLYALGLDKQVVAVDTTSLYPPRALKEKPNVGYMRQLSPEGVLGLSPSLVLASDAAGPKEAVAVLEAASVPFIHVPDHFTGEGIIEKINLVASAAGATARGKCLAASVEADLSALATLRARVAAPVRVIFILSLANGRPMVAGKGTAADGIIQLAGAVNAMTDFEGYKAVSDEAVVAAKPDAVLGMTRPGFTLTGEEIFSQAAFRLTPAAARKSFVTMEGDYLLSFGPRTARAARDLAHALYPALETDRLPSERASVAETCRG